PVLGELMYRAYLRIKFDDGKIVTIEGGPLRGLKLHKFFRTVYKGYIQGNHESELTDAILKACKTGGVFYDIGANAGYMSMVAAKAVGDSGKVVAFEPFGNTVREMRSQLRLNNLRHVNVVHAAVSD